MKCIYSIKKLCTQGVIVLFGLSGTCISVNAATSVQLVFGDNDLVEQNFEDYPSLRWNVSTKGIYQVNQNKRWGNLNEEQTNIANKEAQEFIDTAYESFNRW